MIVSSSIFFSFLLGLLKQRYGHVVKKFTSQPQGFGFIPTVWHFEQVFSAVAPNLTNSLWGRWKLSKFTTVSYQAQQPTRRPCPLSSPLWIYWDWDLRRGWQGIEASDGLPCLKRHILLTKGVVGLVYRLIPCVPPPAEHFQSCGLKGAGATSKAAVRVTHKCPCAGTV